MQGAGSSHRVGVEPLASSITLRAVLVGVLAITIFSIVNPYLAFVFQTWDVGSGQLMNSPVLALFALVAINSLLVRFWPGRAFSRTELLVIYGMLTVSLGLLLQGGLPYLVAIITYPFYAATPQNQWQSLIWPHIPLWFRVGTPEAVDWFWEGMPAGASVPWGAWLRPWVAWGGFTFALMAAMYCLGALLSKDWINKQRLTFPLVEVPLEMTGTGTVPTLGTSAFRSRLFWMGFAVPATFSLLGFSHRFFPNVPSPNLWAIDIGKTFAGMGLPWSILSETRCSILFAIIGVMCLLPTEVSFSLWAFYIIYKLQVLVWASFGVGEGGGMSYVDPRTFCSYEEAGAYIAISAIMIWQSRRFIRQAGLHLLGRAPEEPTGAFAPLSGRAAVLGLVASVTFMVWFGVSAGLSWWVFGLLFGSFFTVLLGSSRLVAAAGVVFPDTGRYGYSFVLNMIGAKPLTTASLVVYTYFSFIYMQDPMNVAMPQMMNSFKLTDSARVRGASWTTAAAIAMVTVLIAGIGGYLHMLYHKGGGQLPVWPFWSWSNWAFSDLTNSLRSPELPSNQIRLAVAIGAVVTTALVWLHTNVIWWPISPIGYLIASTYTANYILWINALIAWLFSSQLKRYGGLRLYRQFRPLFIGLILGDYLPSGFFAILDTIFHYKEIAGG
jgi:hypothetical protein